MQTADARTVEWIAREFIGRQGAGAVKLMRGRTEAADAIEDICGAKTWR